MVGLMNVTPWIQLYLESASYSEWLHRSSWLGDTVFVYYKREEKEKEKEKERETYSTLLALLYFLTS
jgi:hypothetical protein